MKKKRKFKTMKSKRLNRLAKNPEFISAMKEQKSFIRRIKERFLKFYQSILNSSKKNKKQA